MNIKKIIGIAIVVILFVDAAVFFTMQTQPKSHSPQPNYSSAAVKSIDSTIIADGTVTAQDTADLHFQTGGKLVSLPFKEGDTVTQGQTIAQLDTYIIQQQLQQALNTYQSTRDTFDQAQANSQDNALQNQQRTLLASPTNADNAINDAVKRIVDQNQANLNNSVIAVQIANYAFQLATITSPINGVITHEDVKVAGQNVGPTTTFSVADPTTKVFRANVPASDIDYIAVGMNANVMLDGIQKKISGTITNIYPSKVTLTNGESVYQVDIASDDIKSDGKLDQAGSVIIMTNAQNVILIPAWTVLSGKYVWVDNNGTPELKTIKVGSTHGSDIEVTSGLSKNDRVITDPKAIPAKNYPIL
ncbi:MAG TPA: efflux RND transporter periplasmic adaptor subunit [Candidatus Saccharimonadales bacterium]|nr:efflux RND transporter periplasmic adaptor subunit [Candidatus Saccharimonadales bacterium]